jgi:hypothetical protein
MRRDSFCFGMSVEIKAADEATPIHEAQGIPYLLLSGRKTRLLSNFNLEVSRDGITRRVL